MYLCIVLVCVWVKGHAFYSADRRLLFIITGYVWFSMKFLLCYFCFFSVYNCLIPSYHSGAWENRHFCTDFLTSIYFSPDRTRWTVHVIIILSLSCLMKLIVIYTAFFMEENLASVILWKKKPNPWLKCDLCSDVYYQICCKIDMIVVSTDLYIFAVFLNLDLFLRSQTWGGKTFVSLLCKGGKWEDMLTYIEKKGKKTLYIHIALSNLFLTEISFVAVGRWGHCQISWTFVWQLWDKRSSCEWILVFPLQVLDLRSQWSARCVSWKTHHSGGNTWWTGVPVSFQAQQDNFTSSFYQQYATVCYSGPFSGGCQLTVVIHCD